MNDGCTDVLFTPCCSAAFDGENVNAGDDVDACAK